MVQESPKKRTAARATAAGKSTRTAKASTAAKPVAATTRRATPASRRATIAPQLAHAEIALRAHALYVESGCTAGRDEEFWLEAERQLLAERKA